MLLYTGDDAFEYIAKPNQDNVRFGNRIISNDYSMRSLPLNENDSCTVLGFGDSVINGGVLTDQDSLATTLVENQLQSENSQRVRFLNISAGSWGPDNCAAYLSRYGSFNAKMIILFVSSHDAHDNMTFEKIVGVHPSYPEKQYPLAVAELIGRYVWPRMVAMLSKDNNGTAENLMINKGGVEFNSGFDFFKDFTQKNEIPFLICLHAEKIEVEAGQFNTQGDEILKYCLKNNIKVISGLEIGEDVNDFRDSIHLNEKGQKRWAKALLKEIQATIKSCL
jgi:lysophospholipase L1-like esterase